MEIEIIEREDWTLDRRIFLAQTTAGLAMAGVGLDVLAISGTRFSSEEAELFGPKDGGMTGIAEEIAERVRKALPQLELDPEGLAAFARDFVEAREKGQIKPIYAYWLDLPQRFLFSSDFFDNGADVSKVVKYVFFYDPYITPCFNPFASPPPRPA